MKKSYDEFITPQNTPRFQERKIMFLMAMGFLASNMIVFAILFPGSAKCMLVGTILTMGFAVVQCLDRRKTMWTWVYVITWCILGLALTVGFIFAFQAFWYIGVLAAEVSLCCLTAFTLLRTKRKKKK